MRGNGVRTSGRLPNAGDKSKATFQVIVLVSFRLKGLEHHFYGLDVDSFVDESDEFV